MERPKKKREIVPFDQLGKIPPHVVEFEEAIIGALLMYTMENDKETSSMVNSILLKVRAYHFYKETNQIIISAILSLRSKAAPIDVLTVAEECKKMGMLETIGGHYYLGQLIQKSSSAMNIEYWFMIVYQKYILREIIRISNEAIVSAYDDAADCFDVLDSLKSKIDMLDPKLVDNIGSYSSDVSRKLIEELEFIENRVHVEGSKIPKVSYSIGCPRFDEYVSICKNTMLLIAGAASAGKSRFLRYILRILLENYDDVSICWVSLEDSKEDLQRSYAASKMHIKPKILKDHNHKKFPWDRIDELKDHYKRFGEYDIQFVDDDLNYKDMESLFLNFCKKRKNRFNIFVIDNILSLGGTIEYRHNMNDFYDQVMTILRRVKQKTHGCIIPVHHFNDAQQDKQNLKNGYRPVIKDMKGTEAFRRVPNQVLLINSFNIYKDLMAEYSGDQKEILKNIFVVDTGKNRDDTIDEKASLIHLFCDFESEVFWEIPLMPESQPVILSSTPVPFDDPMPF